MRMSDLATRGVTRTAARRAHPRRAALDYDFYKARVQPLFLEKRDGSRPLRDLPRRQHHAAPAAPSRGSDGWTEEQTRQNFEAAKAMVVPGQSGREQAAASPARARGWRRRLSRRRPALDDEERSRTGRCWRRGSTAPRSHQAAGDTRVARIVQTNAAGDNIHLIDPGHQQGRGVINDIEVPHGVTSAPDGMRLVLHQRVAAHARRRRCADAGGDRAGSAQRPAEQRRDSQGRPARLRRHCPGAGRGRRDRHRVADATPSRSRSRARSTTSTSRRTASTSSPGRFPGA